MQSSAPAPGSLSPWDSVLGAIEDSISQCTFLQMTYTAENPHADGSASTGACPRLRPPRLSDPHNTSPAPTTTGCREDRCPVVSKLPLHSLVHQRCHFSSESPLIPSWLPMSRPRLQQAATALPEKIQLPIEEQNFHVRVMSPRYTISHLHWHANIQTHNKEPLHTIHPQNNREHSIPY